MNLKNSYLRNIHPTELYPFADNVIPENCILFYNYIITTKVQYRYYVAPEGFYRGRYINGTLTNTNIMQVYNET